MSEQYDPNQVAQDLTGPGDELPTYDSLSAQSGPNSRFGRWRGWIEKRAAERYHGLSSEELTRRRDRGWGEGLNTDFPEESLEGIPTISNQPATPLSPGLPLGLRIHTDLPALPLQEEEDTDPPSSPPPPLPGQRLTPSRLRLNQFGSRFLPHTEHAIRCVLPLLDDSLLLIGHDRGLSVLDMFPQQWTEHGSVESLGPDDAQARIMWEGEAVYQMSMLEIQSAENATPQGVVLALAGPIAESSRDHETMRTLRMYNLASLISLAKWTISQQKGARPVILHRAGNNSQTPTKKHRSHGSITKGLRSLMTESPIATTPVTPSSYPRLMPPSGHSTCLTPERGPSPSVESGWDIVEDLPLRWATDYISLATPGSRLLSTSVSTYALWHDGSVKGRGEALLAIATKSNILMYEKPKGERAFRFVKEFYTPLQPRQLTFVQQSVQDLSRSFSDGGASSRHRAIDITETLHHARCGIPNVTYSTQLSVFVIFDKKTCIIRIADALVSEVEFPSDGTEMLGHRLDTLSSSTGSRRSRHSDTHGPSKAPWLLPTRIELPAVHAGGRSTLPRTVYFLTRGKSTQILPSPLPALIANATPILSLTWQSQPSEVTPRVCYPHEEGALPFLQLVALGDEGVEVQEVSFSFLNCGKGKGRAEEPVRGLADVGQAGLLCTGGHWHRSGYVHQLTRSQSVDSHYSSTSFDSLDTDEVATKLRMEQGMYAWCRRGLHDWRVFWVGGTGHDDGEAEED